MTLGVQSARRENCNGHQTATTEQISEGHSWALTLECPLGGVAQSGRAADFESAGCGSNPHHPHLHKQTQPSALTDQTNTRGSRT